MLTCAKRISNPRVGWIPFAAKTTALIWCAGGGAQVRLSEYPLCSQTEIPRLVLAEMRPAALSL
jgi:hypothetical protein